MSGKTVLVISPHLDDEALGCGGTIAKHVAQGDRVHICFVAHRVYDHAYDSEKMKTELDHTENAKAVLGYHDFCFFDLNDERLDTCIQDIIIPLEKYMAKVKPQVVYSPFCNDNNQDHRAVAGAVQVVLRSAAAPFIERWLVYETPSSTEQSPSAGVQGFQANVYIDISDSMDIKLKAIACYETETRSYPNPRSPEGIKALAMKRGMEAGLHYVESFMMVREKL